MINMFLWIVMMVAALLLPWLLPNLTEDSYAALFVIITLGGLFVVVLMCWRFLKKLS